MRRNPLSSAPVTPQQQDDRRGLMRSAAVMTVFTLISRVLGLVREQVRGYYLGTGMASDAFALASAIPNLFRRLLGEGAMTAAFVPVFTGYKEKGDRSELSRFLSAFLTLFSILLVLFCFGGILLSSWLVETFFASGFGKVEGKVALTIVLTELMFPYLFLVSLAAIVQAVLNSFRIFGPSSFTPVLLNLSIIVLTVAFADSFPNPSYAMAGGFLLGGVLQLTFQLPWFFRLGLRIRPSFNWSHPGVKELFRIFLPGIFAAGIYQINVFVSEMIASTLNPGSIAALQYSIRLQELVLGVFVISITTVILPTLSSQQTTGDKSAFNDTTRFALRILAFITLPATVGLILLREPIVSLLFQQGEFNDESTRITSIAVLFHSLGIYFIAMSRSLNQSFYAKKDLLTPALLAFVSMVVNISGCLVFSRYLEHGGIALANSLSALTSTVLLAIFLARRGVELGVRQHLSSVGRFLVASAILGGTILALVYLLPYEHAGKAGLAWRVTIYIAGGMAAFYLACRFVAKDELSSISSIFAKRLLKRK